MILGENLWASLSWLGLILATGLLLFLLLGGLLTYTSLLRNTLPVRGARTCVSPMHGARR